MERRRLLHRGTDREKKEEKLPVEAVVNRGPGERSLKLILVGNLASKT